jgi:GntR family transcriptional regulator, arabinose operon transcriptional repressor
MSQRKIKVSIQKIYEELKEDILGGKIPFGNLLMPENELAEKMQVSRPTISKVYNTLQTEGLVNKKAGFGTSVVYKKMENKYRFGLLFPGSGETEIFSIINDQFLHQAKMRNFDCLWEGTVANNAEVRKGVALKICQSYINEKVDGIFFSPLERTPGNEKLNEEICQIIDKSHVPLILIDRDIYAFPKRSKYDLISIDHYHAGYIMAQHLIASGCKTLYFFHRPDSAFSVNLRINGVRAAMEHSKLQFHSGHIICGAPDDHDLIKKIAVVPFETGIVCGNDSTAAILISSLESVGIKISSDLLVAGFDNMKYGIHLKYPLTSYQQPLEEITKASINLMFNKLLYHTGGPVTAYLYGNIVTRASTVFIK